MTAAARVLRALTTRPCRRDWVEFAGIFILVGAVAAPIGLASDLLKLAPRSPVEILKTAAIALIIPALGEEIPFRGLLVPSRDEAPSAWAATLGSTAVFTAWHGLETLWQPQHRALFLRSDFLAWAAWLGFWCAILRRRSGSLWTPVALHWSTVVIWIGWLGGPSF